MQSVKRLYDAIKPTHYRLTLEPDLVNFSFAGQEAIEFELSHSAKVLRFHSVGLKITLAQIDGQSARITYDQASQTVSFEFDAAIPAGASTLTLQYDAPLNQKLHGFYRSSYLCEGQTKYLATTQFEANHAREALICIDEPAAKAVFEVALIVDKNLTTVSNTDITGKKTQADGKVAVKFAPTPKMSPYLLAFLVGEFESIETKNTEGIQVRVLTTPGKKHQAAFALEVAAKTLTFYKDYFGLAYPLTKLDMIAVPDFAAGAMENWGAVTYRETAILVDPQNSSLANRQWAALVIAHELAHQWFGNLVTMEWWTDLWLNEGFASWVEYLAVNHLFPDWDIWTQFVATEYQQARQLDSLAHTHAIEIEVKDPAEINEIFDAISYSKGASVIRMLQHYLGEADFKRGLHDYLQRHSYANATTADLWASLEQASGKPVSRLMSVWTSQSGHPLVDVSRRDHSLLVRQQRFFAGPLANSAASSTIWPIPLQITTRQGTDPDTFLLEKPAAELPFSVKPSDWVKINPGQTGFYLTKYSPDMLAQLVEPLGQGKLPPTDRLGIISDSWALAKAGQLGTPEVLKLCHGFKQESDYAVWMSLLSGLGDLRVVTTQEGHDQLSEPLDQYSLDLITPALGRLGWEECSNNTHFDRLLRPVLLSLAGRLGDEQTLQQARQRLERLIEGNPLPADLRQPVYATIARHGNAENYEQLLRLYQQTDMQEEQRRLLNALALFRQKELIQQTLEFTISEQVRSQDTILGLVAVMSNPWGRRLGWEFVQANWGLLAERYGNSHTLSRIPQALGTNFATHRQARQIERFFNKHPLPSIARSVQQCLEQVRLQADWYHHDKDAIRRYLQP